MKSRYLCLLLSLLLSFCLKKHSSGTTGHIPLFSYSGWGQYVLMMSWFSESLSSFASLSSNAFCTCQGRGLVVIGGSLQLVRPRAETEHNFSLQRWITFPPPGSPFPRSVFLSLSQLLHCLSLISPFSCLILSRPIFLNLNIFHHHHHPPSASLFISWSRFLALFPSASLLLFSLGTLQSAVGLEFQASFIEFTQGPGEVYLPIRSWWGTWRLWANPQIPLKPACSCWCACIRLLNALTFCYNCVWNY